MELSCVPTWLISCFSESPFPLGLTTLLVPPRGLMADYSQVGSPAPKRTGNNAQIRSAWNIPFRGWVKRGHSTLSARKTSLRGNMNSGWGTLSLLPDPRCIHLDYSGLFRPVWHVMRPPWPSAKHPPPAGSSSAAHLKVGSTNQPLGPIIMRTTPPALGGLVAKRTFLLGHFAGFPAPQQGADFHDPPTPPY